MSSAANLHDETVERLTAGLMAIFADRPERTVLSRALWQPIGEFPTCLYRYDAIVVNGPVTYEYPDGQEPRLSSQVRVLALFDVLARGDYEEEFYDKPDLLISAPVSEYCLIDPSGEVMRPQLQAVRVIDGGYCQVRTCADGVFFSDAGVRLQMTGSDISLAPCDAYFIEEPLHMAKKKLKEADTPKAIAGLSKRIEKLERERLRWRKRRNNPDEGWE